MGSKYVDVTAITQVIGCVFNNPSLLDQTDKYSITDDDFPDKFHKVAFGAIYNIFNLGATKISIKNILDFLAQHPKSEAVFKKEKGEEWLLQVAENATSTAFEYYYNRLKKMTLLRAFDNRGVDVSFLYDPDNILDTKKKEIQEEWLDNTSLAAIAQKVTERLEDVVSIYVNETFGDVRRPGEGALELRAKLKEHPDVGVPLYGPLINTVTRGARLRKLYLRSAPSGYGKAIPNNTIIPTPLGNRLVGEIKPGDYLFGQDGKATKVLQIHPQKEQKEIWKVTFSDGRIAKCCGEHLWEYRYDSHRGYDYRVEDIQTIYNRTLSLKNGLRNSENKGYRFHIKLNQPVEYAEKSYELPPYTMGALLGDGSFRYDKTNKALDFSSKNQDIPDLICIDLGKRDKLYKFYAKKTSANNYTWHFKSKDNPEHNLWVEELLKEYPELWNLKSEDKFIPLEYLQGSVIQRRDLLQGLMDTDGTIDTKGRTSYTTISPRLRDDVIELCRSLGYIATYTTDYRSEKYTTGECYHVHIQCPKSEKKYLFKFADKYIRAKECENSNKREEYKDHLAIVDIQKTEEKVDMTCFTVDNENHLFLMNDFIVTHNTRTMVADTCFIGCDMIHDDMFGWIKNGTAEPVLYITTEQELEEIQTMMWAFISGVDEDHIMNNTFVGDEEERVDKAIEILDRSKIYIVELPDFSLRDVEDIIKRNIRENGVKYVVNPKRV